MSETKVTHGQHCTCHLCRPQDEAARILRTIRNTERSLPEIRRVSSPAMVVGSEVSARV